MCGIAGMLSSLPSEVVDLSVSKMLAAQTHRGPDDEGHIALKDGQHVVGLGARRLAIVELSDLGHQPMRDEGTGVTLVYNGELYNAPILRKSLQVQGHRFRGSSDTEVVLRSFLEWGRGCFERFHGMFAVAIWDPAAHRVVLARDHLGIKPLYLGRFEESWVFASEVASVLASGRVPANIDKHAISSYLAYGSVQEPLTVIKGLRMAPKGTVISLEIDGRMSQSVYWTAPEPDPDTVLTDAVLAEGSDLLEQAVDRHLLSDVPVGVFLSSGLDSTAIAKLAVGGGAAETFTVSFPEDPKIDEGPLAREVAKSIGSRHVELDMTSSIALEWLPQALRGMDQPTMDGMNAYMVSRLVAESGMKVSLSGQGGDEVFCGYPSFSRVPRWVRRLDLLSVLPRSARRGAAKFLTRGAPDVESDKASDLSVADADLVDIYFRYRSLLSENDLAGLGYPVVHRTTNYCLDPSVDPRRWLVAGDPIASVGRLEIDYYLGNTLLRDGDVFGMANSLEVRVPFLDRSFLDWILRIPGSARMPKGAPPKSVLRALSPNAFLPAQLRGPKKGFTPPFSEWLRGPLAEMRKQDLVTLKGSGLVDPSGVTRIEELFEFQPHSAAWSRVWSLMVLGHWLDKLQGYRTPNP